MLETCVIHSCKNNAKNVRLMLGQYIEKESKFDNSLRVLEGWKHGANSWHSLDF